jgi:hypothetical protein
MRLRRLLPSSAHFPFFRNERRITLDSTVEHLHPRKNTWNSRALDFGKVKKSDGTLTSMLNSLFAVRHTREREENGNLEGGTGPCLWCYRLSIFYLVLQRQRIMP